MYSKNREMTGYCNRQVQVQRGRRLERGLRELKDMDNRPQLASAIGFVFLHFRLHTVQGGSFQVLGVFLEKRVFGFSRAGMDHVSLLTQLSLFRERLNSDWLAKPHGRIRSGGALMP